MALYQKIIARKSGEKIRILVTDYALPGFKPDIGVDVFTQNADGKNWDLCTQSAEEKSTAMAMSVDDYIKKGRHPMFYAVSFGELLTAIKEVNSSRST